MSCDPCSTCTKVSSIDACTTELLIGVISPVQDVNVVVLDLTTGRASIYNVANEPYIVNISGEVTINHTFAGGHSYQIWINNAEAISPKLNFLIWEGLDFTDMVDCVQFLAKTVSNTQSPDQVITSL